MPLSGFKKKGSADKVELTRDDLKDMKSNRIGPKAGHLYGLWKNIQLGLNNQATPNWKKPGFSEAAGVLIIQRETKPLSDPRAGNGSSGRRNICPPEHTSNLWSNLQETKIFCPDEGYRTFLERVMALSGIGGDEEDPSNRNQTSEQAKSLTCQDGLRVSAFTTVQTRLEDLLSGTDASTMTSEQWCEAVAGNFEQRWKDSQKEAVENSKGTGSSALSDDA